MSILNENQNSINHVTITQNNLEQEIQFMTKMSLLFAFGVTSNALKMARITDNKKLAKEIKEKNNQLIVQGLLYSKAERSNLIA